MARYAYAWTVAFLFLGRSVTAGAQDAGSLNTALVEQAALALEAGRVDQALALLDPPPRAGRATCIYGRALLHKPDIVSSARALLYLDRCYRVQTNSGQADADLGDVIRELRNKLRNSALTSVGLSLRPTSAAASITGPYARDILLPEDELWLPLGKYRLDVHASGYEGGAYGVEVDSLDRMLVPIALHAQQSAETVEIDLGEEAGAELGQLTRATDPRPKKFRTLLAKRYQGAPAGSEVTVATPIAPASRSRVWPAITAGSALAAIGLGVGLQASDHDTSAVISYGAGAALGGLALYLLLRSEEPSDDGPSFMADDELLSLAYQGRF